MQGSRIQPKKKESPVVYLTSSDFSFVKNLEFGEKGEFDFIGSIVKERLDEEEGIIIKTTKISKAKLKQDKRL